MTKSHRAAPALPALGAVASLAAFASSGFKTRLAFSYIEGARAALAGPKWPADQNLILPINHFSSYAMAID